MSAAHVRRGGAAPRQAAQARQGRGAQEDRQAAAGRPGARQQGRRAGLRRLPARDRAGRRWSRSTFRPRPSARPAPRSARPASPSAAIRSSASTTWTARWSTRSSTTSCIAPPTRPARPRRRRRWSTSSRSASACCGFGWVKDARVSRRLPDTLVIDIVERTPAALWQNQRPAGADRLPRASCSTACRSTRCPTCRC